SNGESSACYEYSPFGQVFLATGPFAKSNVFGFSTKYQDGETDLLYYGHRFYDHMRGRWLSRDPIMEEGGPNLYGFVGNSVANKWDALGLDFHCYMATVWI